MKVGLQVYTIRDQLQTAESFRAAMKTLSEIGYEVVELAGVSPSISLEEQKRVYDGEGLTVCSTHTGFDECLSDVNAVVDRHKLFGCEYVVTGPHGDLTSEAAWAEFAKQASEVAAKLAEAGLKYGYHNHSFEFEKFGGRTAMDIMADAGDPDLFLFQLDVFWVQHGGACPVRWINKFGKRAPLLHLKEMGIVKGEQRDVPVGEGNLDWPGIFAAAKETGVEWMLVEQDETLGPSLEDAAVSFRNLKAMGMC